MAGVAGKLSIIGTVLRQQSSIRYNQLFCPFLQVRNYAARKGTREKAKKKKVKVVVKKIGFIPHNMRVKKAEFIPIHVLRHDDSTMPTTDDDVWLRKYHKNKIFDIKEAVECHKETHHPTSYNSPNAFIYAHIDLDMQAEKKGQLVEAFNRSVDVPCPFDHGETRLIMAFSKIPELNGLADEAGAAISGGTELIQKIQTGEISVNDYHFAVAHPEIMADLSVIKGLMKKKWPNPRAGTLGLDLATMVHKILHAINYVGRPHLRQPAFGTITVPIGHLNMEAEKLEKNAIAIIQDVQKIKPKRPEPFITKVSLTSPPSPERLIIDHERFFKTEEKRDTSYDSDEEDEVVLNTA